MTEKNTTGKNSSAGAEKGKTAPSSRKLLLLCLVFFLLIVISAICFLCWFIPKKMVHENPRLILHHIQVDGGGHWQAHPEDLAIKIGLQRGSSLLSLQPDQLRQKLLKIHNIEEATVRVVLPDTVVLQLTERTPRAVMGNQRSPIVLDEKGVSMKRSETLAAGQNLPVIKDPRRDGGSIQQQCQPALDLIMVALNDFPDVKILEISLREKNSLIVSLKYRETKGCIACFPDEGDYHYLLSTLQSAILSDAWQGKHSSHFDLRNKGQVVTR